MKIIPNSNAKQQLTSYLAKIPDGPAKERGIKVGEDASTKLLDMRAKDGSSVRNVIDLSLSRASTPSPLRPWDFGQRKRHPSS